MKKVMVAILLTLPCMQMMQAEFVYKDLYASGAGLAVAALVNLIIDRVTIVDTYVDCSPHVLLSLGAGAATSAGPIAAYLYMGKVSSKLYVSIPLMIVGSAVMPLLTSYLFQLVYPKIRSIYGDSTDCQYQRDVITGKCALVRVALCVLAGFCVSAGVDYCQRGW